LLLPAKHTDILYRGNLDDLQVKEGIGCGGRRLDAVDGTVVAAGLRGEDDYLADGIVDEECP
jgi:hypothetical protein